MNLAGHNIDSHGIAWQHIMAGIDMIIYNDKYNQLKCARSIIG